MGKHRGKHRSAWFRETIQLWDRSGKVSNSVLGVYCSNLDHRLNIFRFEIKIGEAWKLDTWPNREAKLGLIVKQVHISNDTGEWLLLTSG